MIITATMPMMMAPAAARAPPGLLPKSSFLAPSPDAAAAVTTVRLLGRRAGVNRAVRSSRPRDGEWGADPDPSTGTGRMVDEDMATLRRRIREARAALSEDDDDDIDGVRAPPIPGRWTALERRHHVAGVRLLEALLVNTRPGLGAGVLALLLLGVPVTVVFLVGAKLIQAVDVVSSAINGR